MCDDQKMTLMMRMLIAKTKEDLQQKIARCLDNENCMNAKQFLLMDTTRIARNAVSKQVVSGY